MSAATDIGQQEPTANPAEPAEVSPSVSAERPEDTYTQRLRSDPDFAVQEAKKAQSELRRLQSQIKSKIPGTQLSVEELLNSVGGPEGAYAGLSRISRYLANPQIRAALEQYDQTGTWAAKAAATASADADDDFEEPWDRSVKPVQGKVAQLEAELHRLRSDRGVEKVKSYFNQFREELPLDDESWRELTEQMASQAKEWGKSPQGLSVLDGMDYAHFRTLALGKLTKDQIRAAYLRDEATRRADKAALATDVPSRVGTTGREKPAEMPTALDAFLQGCREAGIHPSDFHKLV